MLNKSHSSKRLLLVETGILILVVGLLSLVFLFRGPIQIGYHRLNARLSAKAMARSAKASQGSPDERYTRRFNGHRDALIRLGYLEEHTYSIKVEFTQVERMVADVNRKFPGHPYGLSLGKSLSIIDRPDKMAMWGELVQKFGTNIEDPCQPVNPWDGLKAAHDLRVIPGDVK
jgi:hypothetical protein